MSFSNGLERINPHGIAFPDLHDLGVSHCSLIKESYPPTLPKLPFPMTLSSSNESIVSGV